MSNTKLQIYNIYAYYIMKKKIQIYDWIKQYDITNVAVLKNNSIQHNHKFN